MRKGVPLIPVLVFGAAMPGVGELLESLAGFAYRNAMQIDAGRDFDTHMARLVRAVDGILRGNGRRRCLPLDSNMRSNRRDAQDRGDQRRDSDAVRTPRRRALGSCRSGSLRAGTCFDRHAEGRPTPSRRSAIEEHNVITRISDPVTRQTIRSIRLPDAAIGA